MTITNQDFSAYRGDSHVLHVDLTQADGTPFDPTLGATMRWYMTRNPADESEAAVRKETNNGIDPVTGGVDITLSAADTDQPVGLYYHELKVWDLEDVSTAMSGYCVIQIGARMADRPTVLQGNLTLSKWVPTKT